MRIADRYFIIAFEREPVPILIVHAVNGACLADACCHFSVHPNRFAFSSASLGSDSVCENERLTPLSISNVTQCEPCMEWHLDQALQSGATDEEVYETIDVAIEMGSGQAGAYARFDLNAMEFFKQKKNTK